MVNVKRTIKDLNSDTQRSINMVSSEYAYAKELIQQLERIEKEQPKVAEHDLRAGFRILKWIGRGERKANRSENKMMKDLGKIYPILPLNLREKEHDLVQQFEVAEGKIKRAASMFVGDLKSELLKIETEEGLIQKIEQKSPEEAQRVKLLLTQLFGRAKNDVRYLRDWVQSIEAILTNIKHFAEDLEKMAA